MKPENAPGIFPMSTSSWMIYQQSVHTYEYSQQNTDNNSTDLTDKAHVDLL
jgi:hypothetical protein